MEDHDLKFEWFIAYYFQKHKYLRLPTLKWLLQIQNENLVYVTKIVKYIFKPRPCEINFK